MCRSRDCTPMARTARPSSAASDFGARILPCPRATMPEMTRSAATSSLPRSWVVVGVLLCSAILAAASRGGHVAARACRRTGRGRPLRDRLDDSSLRRRRTRPEPTGLRRQVHSSRPTPRWRSVFGRRFSMSCSVRGCGCSAPRSTRRSTSRRPSRPRWRSCLCWSRARNWDSRWRSPLLSGLPRSGCASVDDIGHARLALCAADGDWRRRVRWGVTSRPPEREMPCSSRYSRQAHTPSRNTTAWRWPSFRFSPWRPVASGTC